MTTPLLQDVERFEEGGEIVGFGGRGYKESWPWCSLLVRFPSLFVAPSGEQLTLSMCWRGTSLSTISRVFVPIFFSGQCVIGSGVPAESRCSGKRSCSCCTRISSQEYVYDK